MGRKTTFFHAVTMPGDGSLVRARITLPSDSRKLYYQRVAAPGPASDFSVWTYADQYDCSAVAAASQGSEVSVFWINSSREVRRMKSTDYGVSWGAAELIDYSPTTAVNGMAAAYKPNGDLAVFFVDQATLYVKKMTGGAWQAKSAWPHATGDLSGVAALYDNDWDLLVTGRDTDGNFKLWSLACGDGGSIPVGNWSALQEMATATSGSNFEYRQPFLDKPDVYRCFFTEKFTGTPAYDRPFWSHAVSDTAFPDILWREPVPFDLSAQYGLAFTHFGNYCWLSAPFGLWRAALDIQSLNMTEDVMSLRIETEERHGALAVEVRNEDGRYSSLPLPLAKGCRLEVSLGYVTSSGHEVSGTQSFTLESYEHTSSGGKASLVLNAGDGWRQVSTWIARHQFRWNKTGSEKSVKEIIAFVLARYGLQLETKSESTNINTYYPDFTVQPDDRGDAIIGRLLSFVPDLLFLEGGKAYLVNPQASDSPVYSYGTSHPLHAGRYKVGAWDLNHIRVEGYDPVSAQTILVDSFDWQEISGFYERMCRVEDRNLGTLTQAQERGETCLRKAAMASTAGDLLVPVNCGQQLYDVIDVTDARAGLSAVKKRVMAMMLVFQPAKGRYELRVRLGGV